MSQVDPARFRLMYELFEKAVSLPPEQHRSFVQAQCPEDASMVDEVLELLRDQTEGGGALLAKVREAAERDATTPLPAAEPDRIGIYRIVRELGRGGMGTVYQALQTEPVHREVALKVINVGIQGAEIVQRFERERQALAMMQHDGIAKVHECGTTEQGQPYLVMELVAGEPLTDYCNHRRVSLTKRLRLIRQLCDAIHHAHRKGIVHRDLKPGNVLVTDKGGKLQVKVIDFGLAKSVRAELPAADYRTLVGDWGGGTPAYMAPEQASVDEDIDTLADVYSIGVIMYELLVGSLPLPNELLMKDGGVDMFRILRETEPQRPSVRLAAADDETAREIAESCRTPIAVLRRSLRQDLDWVAARALQKDPGERYESAAALAADVKRFLENQPLEAGPPSTPYRVSKFARRYRNQLLTAGLIIAVMLTAVIYTAISAIQAAKSDAGFQQLAGIVSMRQLRERSTTVARELPGNAESIQRWLSDARALVAARSNYESGLAELANKAESLDTRDYLVDAMNRMLADFDWLVPEIAAAEARANWLRQIRQASTTARTDRPSWDDVRTDLQSNGHYRDCDVSFSEDDIVGLVPIGRNKSTGLWEFYHLRSACDGSGVADHVSVPSLEESGHLRAMERTGIVFVLVPGGETVLSPKTATAQRRSLAPYLLARHELTRGQWQRLGGDPSVSWHEVGVRDHQPVENMDWNMANDVLQRHGLSLPTEAQWEHACRAGTETAWWTGRDRTSLARAGILWKGWPPRNQPRGPAVVSSGDFNAFGFYDMHGNVREWCRDLCVRYEHYDQASAQPDGLLLPTRKDIEEVCVRGGSLRADPDSARSSSRRPLHPNNRNVDVGLRASRPWRLGS